MPVCTMWFQAVISQLAVMTLLDCLTISLHSADGLMEDSLLSPAIASSSVGSLGRLVCAIDLLHIAQNAPVPYPTMHLFDTEMCISRKLVLCIVWFASWWVYCEWPLWDNGNCFLSHEPTIPFTQNPVDLNLKHVSTVWTHSSTPFEQRFINT